MPKETVVACIMGIGIRKEIRTNNEPLTLAVALQRGGYTTAMLGKYLNRYCPGKNARNNDKDNGVPMGWNEWDVAGS